MGIERSRSGLSLELDPTVTALRSDHREPSTREGWQRGGTDFEPGITASWRPTPSWTVNAAGNPDFSQVESDAIRLDVNRQFALFYPERRPFFVEGADFFSTPLRLVHTRDIADPSWGAKLSGRQGRSTLGLLVAEDDVTTLLIPGSQGSELKSLGGANKLGILRYRRDVGSSSALGGVLTHREARDYRNDVAALDGVLRWSDFDSLSFQGVATVTEGERSSAASEEPAAGFQVAYVRDTTNWKVSALFLNLDDGVRADLGFLPQVGFERMSLALSRRWYPKSESIYEASVTGAALQDRENSGELLFRSVEVSESATGDDDTVLNLGLVAGTRTYRGREYSQDGVSVHFERRFGPDWYSTLEAKLADEIDLEGERQAEVVQIAPGLEATLGPHFSGGLGLTYEKLRIDSGDLYRA